MPGSRRLVLAGPPGVGKRTLAGLLESEHCFELLPRKHAETFTALLGRLGRTRGDALATWHEPLPPRSAALAGAAGVELVWLRAVAPALPTGPRIVDAVDAFDEPRPVAVVAAEILAAPLALALG